jgi:hypothetical protein
MQSIEIKKLLNYLSISPEKQDEVFEELGEGISHVVKAATNLQQPKTATLALDLLTALITGSSAKSIALWSTLDAHERKALVIAATNLSQPSVCESALIFLTDLTAESKIIRDQLWTAQTKMGHETLLAPLTKTIPSKIAKPLYYLLANLALGLEARTTALWSALGKHAHAALISAASTPHAPTVKASAMRLLGNLALNSATRTNQLWTRFGVAGRVAVITTATRPALPSENLEALYLMVACCLNSQAVKAEVSLSLDAEKYAALIYFATNFEQTDVAEMALVLLGQLQAQQATQLAIWPLLQPKIVQLCSTDLTLAVAEKAKLFLFAQIRGDAQKTSQVLNVLGAAVPAISLRQTLNTLRAWGQLVRLNHAEQTALLRGIVQSNTSAKNMGVFIAAVMSGLHLGQLPHAERDALRDQLLAIPMAIGINTALYRQNMRLGFDAACSSTLDVIMSQALSEPEKLKRLEILYISSEFIDAQSSNIHFSEVLRSAHISRDFQLQAIGLILHHGQATNIQFKTILAWVQSEFEKDIHTVFTNPETLKDIDKAAVVALAEQRQQYLILYQNFRPHMTPVFIHAEIEKISRQILAKEIPDDFGKTLIFQLQQFLSTAAAQTVVSINRQHDRKSESK